MLLKNRNVAILIGSLALVTTIAYGYWNFIITPLKKSIVAERQNASELSQKLASVKGRADQLNKIQTEMQGLQVEVVELERQLPKSKELPSLIRIVSHRLESYGLTLTTFAPQKPVSKGLYDELPYQVSLTASFHSLGNFLTAMGKGERLFAARNLTLQSSTAKEDPAKTVNATFTLIAFKYHE